ncbi:hypothetical protein JMN32_18720 [Fulvivirga sp. 29W222]|uniref:Uncharacterized protein n=1 Tax=Fulvivirga marina TaxID=2494733 RepID=A0A937KDD5_9BACT|nr:hypothetical protein [Fulvivirga marina]MBL6448354.1 hypothetical protein [Fulvivirga marina]
MQYTDLWRKHGRVIQFFFGVLIALLIVFSKANAQSGAGFIYGKVYTVSNTYHGQIRWGKEEAFWNDLFNGIKLYRNNYGDVSKKTKENTSWLDFDWRLSSIWDDKGSSVSHQFVSRFGDIKIVEITGPSRVNLILKNGVKLEIGGEGYNDLGGDIKVMDKELGLVTIAWNKLLKIEFEQGPDKLSAVMGNPLFGTVETARKGSFTGFVQWDHDERLSVDKLDGDARSGQVSISFSNIKRIEKDNNGSNVLLKSGSTYFLTNSNDVDSGNRGVIVSVEGTGKIEISWKAFKSVEFSTARNSGLPYESYPVPRELNGTVYLYEGKSVSGIIIYDIDESWDVEILEGMDDEIQYHIPFRNIRKVTPKNYDYSLVELKNGTTLLLGGMRDVSDENDGILILKKGGTEQEFIDWKNIMEIVFD